MEINQHNNKRLSVGLLQMGASAFTHDEERQRLGCSAIRKRLSEWYRAEHALIG